MIFSFLTIFLIYVGTLFLSTPFNSIFFKFFDVESLPLSHEFNYWLLFFRYIFWGILFWLIILLIENRKAIIQVLKDSSLLRIAHFGLMFLLGFITSHFIWNWKEPEGQLNFIILCLGMFATILVWFFAAGINNFYDQRMDAVTNKSRGLITGTYTRKLFN